MSLLATDTLYQFGGRLAQFSETTQQGLEPMIESSALPNPVDLGDQADAAAYGRALDLVLADPGWMACWSSRRPAPSAKQRRSPTL